MKVFIAWGKGLFMAPLSPASIFAHIEVSKNQGPQNRHKYPHPSM